MGYAYKVVSWLSVIFNPLFWLMNNPLSKEWDAQLRGLMDHHKFENRDRHTAKIGEVVVWIGNYPYAAFTPVYPVNMDIRPTRRTIMAARKKMVSDFFS